MKLEGEWGSDGDQRCFNKAHGAGGARRIQGAIAGPRSGGITKKREGRYTTMKERKRREKM